MFPAADGCRTDRHRLYATLTVMPSVKDFLRIAVAELGTVDKVGSGSGGTVDSDLMAQTAATEFLRRLMG